MITPTSPGPRSEVVVLVVGPRRPLPSALSLLLEGIGYGVRSAESAAEARAAPAGVAPQAIILEPGGTAAAALELCAAVTAGTDVPVLLCTAPEQKAVWTAATWLGVVDFLATPVDADELQARVEAALRRPMLRERRVAPPPVISVGDLCIRHAAREVTLGGTPVALTGTEYRLLHALASRPGETIPRAELAGMVWSAPDRGLTGSRGVHARRLRGKLQRHAGGARPPRLLAVRGVGHQLVGTAGSEAAGASDVA